MSTLQDAIEEAYASAPDDEIVLHALEIDHPSFTAPLRVVNWPVTGPDLEVFILLHEDDAGLDPGELVEYRGFPYEITLPESSADTAGTFKLKVGLYNDFDQYLAAAATSPGVITATYRQYIKGREEEGPATVWPGIEITSPRREGGAILADGSILGWMARPYGNLYTPIDYPALTVGR